MLAYSSTHIWAYLEDEHGVVGITSCIHTVLDQSL
jgi:glycine cleavage system H lipoate-binding protein